MNDAQRTRRRVLLQGSAILAVLGAGCSGDDDDTVKPVTSTPSPTPHETSVSIGSPDGLGLRGFDFSPHEIHWIWFPAADVPGGRSSEPFEVTDDVYRWLAWPTEDGGIRCRVEDDAPPGSAGFMVPAGRIGDLRQISLDVETIHSDSGAQQIGIAVYIDVDGDGEYLRWTEAEDHETFRDAGDDAQTVGTIQADGRITVGLDVTMDLLTANGPSPVTLDELTHERVDGVSPLMDAAVHISVLGSGTGNAEELVVHGVEIERSLVNDGDWPMYARDKRNWGRNPVSEGSVTAVEPRWVVETGGSVRSSPAVVDGTVYVGSDDGHLYAIDATDGTVAWTVETGGPIVSSPAVAGQTVYVGSDDATLYAISTNTAEIRWTYGIDGPIRSPVTVDFDAETRQIDNAVAFGSETNALYVLEATSGDRVLTIPTEGPVVCPPSLLKFDFPYWHVFFGSLDGTLWNWNVDWTGAGDPFYTRDREDPIYAGVNVRLEENEPRIYVATDGGTLSKERYRGFQVWTYEADAGIRTTPTFGVDPRSVFVGSQDGTVHAITNDTGEAIWTSSTDGPIDGAISIAGDAVYLGSGDGRVYGLDADSGDQLWSYATGDAVRTSPAVVDGTVFVGSDDGCVYALETAD